MATHDIDTKTCAIAFGLVMAAAASTGIGASLVFFPKLVKLPSRLTLAFALAMSAGVMMYISMVDIYTKAMVGFADSGHDEGRCFIYTTLSFFGGIAVMMILNRLIIDRLFLGKNKKSSIRTDENEAISHLTCASAYENVERMTDDIIHNQGTNQVQIADTERGNEENSSVKISTSTNKSPDTERGDEANSNGKKSTSTDESTDTERGDDTNPTEMILTTNDDQKTDEVLFKMGVATAISIALHNLPEGLVTFIAYVTDPTVGIVLAIGIALHNIPEGVCVAIPVYYATGNRCRAFRWGILSGVSEPIGALIGWIALGQSGFSGNAYGIMFGLVAGIMVFIAIDELLPTAQHYDPNNTVTTSAFILGMFVIAASLMIFSL